ncbi:MAG TPA: RidA family protein [Gemmatimonadales bacterium]|nr:RidA family protein [Gemmatimonadales bacterium]
MRTISTDDAPPPAGHYAQGVAHAGVIYVAGMLPKDPARPDAPHGTVEEQVERTLRNVEAVLRAGGSSLEQLLSVTIYVTDLRLWPRVNAAYARVLGEHRPARTVVPVPELAAGYLVEIQATGAIASPA